MNYIKLHKIISKPMLSCLLIVLFSLYSSFAFQGAITFSQIWNVLFEKEEILDLSQAYFSNYTIKDRAFTSLTDDPMIQFWNLNRHINDVSIAFAAPLREDENIEIYYSKNGTDYTNTNCIKVVADKQSSLVNVLLSKNVGKLRVDITTKAGQTFLLDKIVINSQTISKKIFALTFMLLMSIFVTLIYLKKNKIISSDTIETTIFVLIAGTIYFAVALNLNMKHAPDELARFDLPKWIFYNGRLPIGSEPELMVRTGYGMSYGFSPYLPALVSVLFMKIFSLFSTETVHMVLAARLVSVFSGMGTVYFCMKIGRKLFANKVSCYLYTAFVGFLPQFIFLCGYTNNDSCTVFEATMIIYFWIVGTENHWRYLDAFKLSIPLSMCILTYYNAYGYILSSILVLFLIVISDKEKTTNDKCCFFTSRAFFVILIIFALVGWYFIRNAVIYNGDFLGLKARTECSEQFAPYHAKPSHRNTPRNLGKSIWSLFDTPVWITLVAKSYAGLFGNMEIESPTWFYISCLFLIGIGMIFGIYSLNKSHTGQSFLLILLISIITPFLLTMFYSYASDWQPQGRYCISNLPAIMLITVYGYDYIHSKVKKNLPINDILLCLWLIIVLYIYTHILGFHYCNGIL